jgi:hypothetical protein
VYRPDGAGGSPVVRRLFSIGTTTDTAWHGGHYAHSDVSAGWDAILWDQLYVLRQSSTSGLASSAQAITVQNSFFHTASPTTVGGGSSFTSERVMMKDFVGGAFLDAGPVDTTSRTRVIRNSVFRLKRTVAGSVNAIDLSSRNGSLLIENCVILMDDVPNASSAIGIKASRNTSLTVTVNNCIIVVSNTSGGARPLSMATGVVYTGNHNIFVQKSSNVSPGFVYAGTFPADLAAWKTATGQDTNSVYMNTAQYATFWQGDPATGDFRINASNGVKGSDGTTFTGTFPDGVAISTAGPQEHFNWNTRAITAGPPARWPEPPDTMAEAQTYVIDPTAWNFYP